MINYKYFDLFWEDSLPKEVKIESGNIVLTNDDLYNQKMELEESLCSDEGLRFGCCEASVFKFKTSEMFVSMAGKQLNVSLTLNGNPDSNFSLGIYKVDSDKLDASKRYREVVAYDAMYDIINADMASWYNSVLPSKNSSMKLKQFRESFVRHFGLTEVVQIGGLVNDNMTVERTIEPEQISGKDIITAICEINGCFGHIGRDGKFHYIYLPQAIEGLYPANDLYPDHAPEYMSQSKTGHLYPQDPKGITVGKNKNYIECTYEDFIVSGITHIQIRGSENDAGYTYPSTPITESDNLYVIDDNFLTYGKSDAELMQIEINLLSKISNITYRPYNLKVRANPCIEVGDAIMTNTDRQLIESYVLCRTMTGIQAFFDDMSADGTKKFEENVNSVQRSIVQLKGKTNTLERTQEETRSELKDLESDTESRFIQTAEEIQMEVVRAQGAEGQLSSRIALTVKDITLQVNNGYQTAGIVITLENEDGSTETINGNIQMTGTVTFSDLAGNGSTIINGSNITTGTISADRIDTENLVALNGKFTEHFEIGIGGSSQSGGLILMNTGAYGYADTDEIGFQYNTRGIPKNGIKINSNGVSIFGNISFGLQTISGTISNAVNATYAEYADKCSNVAVESHEPNTYIAISTGKLVRLNNGSARKFKENIKDVINPELDPRRLYDISIRQFNYRAKYLGVDDGAFIPTEIGFIADEVLKVYPIAADLDEETKEPINWKTRSMIPPMLALIQEQHKEIEDLKMSLLAVQGEIAILRNQMEELKNAK